MEKIVTKVIGYILLSPALISVVLFFIQLIDKGSDTLGGFSHKSAWIGTNTYGWIMEGQGGSGGGFSSSLPIYIGLLALVGAYLIKDNKSK